MLLTTAVKTQWTKCNKKRYENKGYAFTKIGDTFLLDVKDLTKGCDKRVDVRCDICGKVKNIAWNKYLKQHDEEFGDLCIKCCNVKKERTTMEHYGVKNSFQSEEIKSKIKDYWIENYNVENPMHIDDIKEKQRQTTFNHYNVYYCTQNKDVLAKQKETCKRLYGFENVMDNEEIKLKAVMNQRKSYYKNGKTYSASKVELKMCNILQEMFGEDSCSIGYYVYIYTLDCLLNINDCKIDIEYDGQYWHNLNNAQESDKKRDDYLIQHGYKVLRVKGNRKVPTKEQLQNAIDYLVKGNHSYTEIILDI